MVVIKSSSLYNIVIDPETKKRVFSSESLVYRCISQNRDITELITSKVTKMNKTETLQSLHALGRDANKKLRTQCFLFYDTIGWDQESFDIGFDFITETFYEKIPEDVKYQYLETIEEAFFTMSNRQKFHAFIRNAAEGSIATKNNFSELLSDLMEGVKIENMLSKL